jgi:hypothetical protein
MQKPKAIKAVEARTFPKQTEKVQTSLFCLPGSLWQLLLRQERVLMVELMQQRAIITA